MCWELLIQIEPKERDNFDDYVRIYSERIAKKSSFPFKSRLIWISKGKRDSDGSIIIEKQEWYLNDQEKYSENEKMMKVSNEEMHKQNQVYQNIFTKNEGVVISYQTEDEGDKKYCGCNTGFIDDNEELHIRKEILDFFKELKEFSDKFYFIYFNEGFLERLDLDFANISISSFEIDNNKEKHTGQDFFISKEKITPNKLYIIK